MTANNPDIRSSRSAAVFQRAQHEARVRSSGVGIPAHPAHAAPRSGIMPDARGLVLCPHCRKGFPFSAALLNRQIRCNGCRGVFRVAEDRRSFILQPPPQAPSAEVGSSTKLARAAIREANSSLNETARMALRSLERHQPTSPKHHGTAIASVVPPDGPGLVTTARLARKRSAKLPALSGAGLDDGRRRRVLLAIAVAVVVLGTLVVWSGRSDPRLTALSDFQTASRLEHSWSDRVADMRSRSLSSAVSPITAFDDASLSPVESLDLKGLNAVLSGMRVLVRGHFWVEGSRHGEATALLTQADLNAPGAIAAYVTRCKKAGITLRSWDEVIAMASPGQPAGGEDVLRLMLNRPAPRGGGFDPVALFDVGQLPTSILVSQFSGQSGALLQTAGPPRPQAYRGRLVRCSGTGWSGRWQILDLMPSP